MRTAGTSAERPIVKTTATSNDQTVERTERSFVHSDASRRGSVTRPCEEGAAAPTPDAVTRHLLAILAPRAPSELELALGDVHECFLERHLLRRQFVQGVTLRRRERRRSARM